MQSGVRARALGLALRVRSRPRSCPRAGFSTSFSQRGPVTWASLALTGVVGGGLVVYYQTEKDRRQHLVTTKQKTVGKPSLGGPWTLVNMDGKPVTDLTYRGRFTLLYFGFTRCPDICPSELVKVGDVLDSLGSNLAQLDTLFISVDPNRDTLRQLRAYAQDFHPSIHYLTGTKDQVKAITKAYRVYFIKANENEEDEDDYLVDHSTVLYLVGPDGGFQEFFTSSETAKDIAAKIEAHITDSSGPSAPGSPGLPFLDSIMGKARSMMK